MPVLLNRHFEICSSNKSKKKYLGQSKSSVVTILFPYRKLKKNFLFPYSDREKNVLFFYAI